MAGFRAMTPEQRATMAAQMSILIRRLTRDGIRHSHPEYSDSEVSRALTRALYGDQIAKKIRLLNDPAGR